MPWTKTCPKCGMSWQAEYGDARICPFCHCDIVTGTMPGEDLYNGNRNNGQPNYNNQPNSSSGGGEDSWNREPVSEWGIWGWLTIIGFLGAGILAMCYYESDDAPFGLILTLGVVGVISFVIRLIGRR